MSIEANADRAGPRDRGPEDHCGPGRVDTTPFNLRRRKSFLQCWSTVLFVVVACSLFETGCGVSEVYAGLFGRVRVEPSKDPEAEFKRVLERHAGQATRLRRSPSGRFVLAIDRASGGSNPQPVSQLFALGWNPATGRLYRFQTPMWRARLSGTAGVGILGISVSLPSRDVDRIGPGLLLDHRGSKGERVLVWTE